MNGARVGIAPDAAMTDWSTSAAAEQIHLHWVFSKTPISPFVMHHFPSTVLTKRMTSMCWLAVMPGANVPLKAAWTRIRPALMVGSIV
jgi:hypothetical protein